ncbi:MAG: TonB-dependent receptor [Bacteroidales bacterium]|nr:TonB-dependent receptor [Bacteroidales bacterium]
MKSRLLLCLTALLVGVSLHAQVSVSGTVVSSADRWPLVGAVVMVQGNATLYTITDLDGNYTISGVSPDDVLEFSMMGYSTQQVTIGNKGMINVALDEEATLLEETVVIGYGTVKKKDLTGSVSSVNSEKLLSTIATSADQMLQGKVAGVQITSNSGAPGAATSIRIRGASSINNTNEPLYIIDGVPFSGAGNEIGGFDWAGGTNGQNVVNPLSTISPSDIVSMDILKDASATAIYGANGANGVIIITTKRGTAGKVNITYDGYVTAQMITNKLDMMNLREYATYQIGLCEDLNQTVSDMYLDPSLLGKGTDWQDEIFRTAWMHSHSVSITGGTEKIQVAASGGYTKQDGVIIGSDFTRFNARLNLDATIMPWLKGGASLAFTHTSETITNNDGTDGVVLQALTMQPSVPVYDLDGNWAGPDTVNGASYYNPVWLAEMKSNDYQRNRSMGNFYLSINPIPELSIRTEYAFDYSDNNNRCFVPTYSFGDYISSDINQIMQREDHSIYWIWKTYANYNKTFGTRHNFGAMIGYEMSRSEYSGNQLIKKNLSTDTIQIVTNDGDYVSNSGWKGVETMVSAFGRVNYNYDERYYVTATLRADASSKFGANNKWGYFPSVALAWRISREPFFDKARNVVNEFKLRLGYGQVGNSNISSFLYTSTMSSLNTWAGTGYYMSNISNPDLKWEASEQFNGGIDIEFMQGRFVLTIDGYYKRTKDLLLQLSVPAYLGGTTTYQDISTPMVNMGRTSNRGFDMNLTTHNIVHPHFNWTTNLVFSLNRNKVDALNSDTQTISGAIDWYSGFQTATKIMVGQPIGVFYGYVVEGLFQSPEDILSSPVQVPDASQDGAVNLVNVTTGVYAGDIKFKDLNGDGVIDENDQTVIGDPNPKFTFGFTNSFSIGDWEVSLALTGAVGGDILNFARYRTESMTSIWDNQTTAALDRARYDSNGNLIAGTGYSSKHGYIVPRAVSNDPNQNNRMSDRWIEDGSYLRIQNLTVGYNVPAKALEKVKLATVKAYINAQNLYTFTKYSGYDPEIGAYNQSALLQNIDRGRYPTPMSITLGVTIGF